MANSFQSYALALLTLLRNQEDVNDNPPLGIAIRRDDTDSSSSFNMPAHNFLRILIEHSPSPETLARLFIAELASQHLNSSDRSVSPDDWAIAVQGEIRQTGGNMTPLTDLASFSLTCLSIGFRKPSVRNLKAPQLEDSLPLTPNRILDDFCQEQATARRHRAAFQEPILRRDGPRCLITGAPFDGDYSVIPHCAHIIPFSIHDKPILHYAIEMFTGPWGIEARSVNNEWKYYFRVVKSVPCFITLKDGDEIQFGRGSGGRSIALPDPRACNLHLAIARVFAASGAAEVVDKYLEDFGHDQPAVPVSRSTTRPSCRRRYFGGQYVNASDDVHA
ncbi:hypothetical protein F5888DRAFT_1889780 [Russula emetica]|nr:hypothetical protein F5888DRAFT_1889780 [Russula emetica]